MAFRLTSPAFADRATIPRRHCCDGEDLAPPLQWEGAPSGTRSFALTCDDPDAPRGVFRHWAVFDIPADRGELPVALAKSPTLPDGLRQATNDFGRAGYGGPCPPRGHGVHHYHFRLHALDVDRLAVGARAGCEQVAAAMRPHVIDHAELVGVFEC